MKIGFIGIGSMGAAMVPHLVAAGHEVSVWNRNPAAAQALAGVTVLATPAAAFDNDVVLTMLANDVAVREVIIESGAIESASAQCIHVMMSTISLSLVEQLEQLHGKRGVAYIAAPVFGVPAVAARAELNILVAGPARAVATVRPVLESLGKKIWPLGEIAQHANIAKISGNLMITMAIEGMAEACALTESHGLKAAAFLEIVTNTMFASPSYKRYGGNISSSTYEPGFKLTLGLKDVNLALEAAAASKAALPVAEIVRRNMMEAVDQGRGASDWSAFAEVARARRTT